MKTIIAGSRGITNFNIVAKAIQDSQFPISEVVSGGAKGVDQLGERWAAQNKIPTRVFPAQWDKLGKSAGYRRNEDMAKYANALIAIWDGQSKGTKHMIDIAKSKGLQVYVIIHTDERVKAQTENSPIPERKDWRDVRTDEWINERLAEMELERLEHPQPSQEHGR